MSFEIGDRVVLNLMAFDGLDDPGEIIGFVEDGIRKGQPIIRWTKDRKSIFGNPKESICHPQFLWLESEALNAYYKKRNTK